MRQPARETASLALAFSFSLVFAAPACRRTPSAPPPPPPDVATPAPTALPEPTVFPTAARPASADPLALERACDLVRARSRAVLDAALSGGATCPRDRDLALRQRFDRCERGPSGAWTLELRALSVRRPNAQCDGRWALVHVARDGAESVLEPARFSDAEGHPANLRSDAQRYDLAWELRVADLDGDGDPEAFLTERGLDGTTERRRTGVFTARTGAVTPYAPAARYEVEDARDVDEDGRLDLVHYGPYAGFEAICGGDEVPFGAVPLLAHTAPDGSFVDDSGIAISFARRGCGRRPGDVSAGLADAPPLPVEDAGEAGAAANAAATAAPSAPDVDAGSPVEQWRAAGRAVACARMYGLASGAVERMLARSCRSYASPEPCARPSLPPGVCPSYLLHWARLEPPVRIR